MKFIQLSLFTLLVVAALATNFDIVSSSSCTNVSQGICVKWEQNGTVQEQMGSCFPGMIKVMTKKGLTEMKDLRRGDEILGLINGKQEFTKMVSWLHKVQNIQSDYIRLHFSKGWLQVSPKHNLANTDMDFVFADQITSAYPAGQIVSVSRAKSLGLYAPNTESFNYFVYLQGDEGEKVLAHSFAHIKHPEMYEYVFNLVQTTWELFEDCESQEIHPSYTWMQNTFTILQE